MNWLPIAQGFALVVAAVLLVAIIGAAYWLFSMPIQRSSGGPTTYRIPYRLANGKTVMVFGADRIIDNTKPGEEMREKIDVYVNGTYLGEMDFATGQAIALVESREPHRVHGVVDQSCGMKPRLSLNPVEAESPALVRRVLEVMDGAKKPTIKEAAAAFQTAINSEPGIEAEIRGIVATNIGDLYPRKIYTVTVSQTKKQQVYP